MRLTESLDPTVESPFHEATIGGLRTSDNSRGESPPRVRPAPSTFVLAGAVPDPLLSSRSRGWNGITVELHSFHHLDSLVQPADHVIAIHLAGAVNLQRIRHARSRVRKMIPGDIAITPAGPPVRWTQSSQSLVILLRLTPAYVQKIAGDECAIDPDRFEIREEFSTRDANIEALGRGNLIDQLYKKVSRPSIVHPTFITNHPIDLSPHPVERLADTTTVERVFDSNVCSILGTCC